MKVGRWRRERLGQNGSHTREVIVILLLLLLFGAYRLWNLAETESEMNMASHDDNPDNIVLPMASNDTASVDTSTTAANLPEAIRDTSQAQSPQATEKESSLQDTKGAAANTEKSSESVSGSSTSQAQSSTQPNEKPDTGSSAPENDEANGNLRTTGDN